MRTRYTTTSAVALGLACTLALSACGSDEPSDGAGAGPTEITVATHDSWNMDPDVVADFTAASGIEVKILQQGDAGELTNKLALTKGNPIADAVYGIDNTFASRAVEAGVLAEHASPDAPAEVDGFDLADDEIADYLTPIDYGDVCVNIDDTWFAREKLDPPQTLQDLVDPAYRGLFVTPGATTSSPGLAFLLATISVFGEDGWQDYWEDLLANDAKVVAGWTDAYSVDFTAGGGDGPRPIVLSYSSSPPFTVPEGGSEPTTSALLDTCFRQVEYAGVLAGAEHPDAAAEFIDFMLTREFQRALPDTMYVYPVDAGAPLPDGWRDWAATAEQPHQVSPAEITANRSDWLREWRDLVTR